MEIREAHLMRVGEVGVAVGDANGLVAGHTVRNIAVPDVAFGAK